MGKATVVGFVVVDRDTGTVVHRSDFLDSCLQAKRRHGNAEIRKHVREAGGRLPLSEDDARGRAQAQRRRAFR